MTTQKIKRLEVKASRWPWQQGYNWHGMTNSTAPLNQPLPGEKAAPRFGGGWRYKLGFSTGGWHDGRISFLIDLLFGMVKVTYRTRARIESDKQEKEEMARRLAEQRAKWAAESAAADRARIPF